MTFLKDDFHKTLTAYINGSCFSKKDFFISLFNTELLFRRNAIKIIQQYQSNKDNLLDNKGSTKKILIQKYKGKNLHVFKMADYLESHLKDELYGAYIHGSLGTYEEISYSDFDALVIIKDKVFEDSRRLTDVALKLNAGRLIMLNFDPLQHHGWFVLTEAQLKAYPEYYFPVELFSYAKSLLPNIGLELTIHIKDLPEKNKESFMNLSKSIIERIDEKRYPENIYQLKGLLSQFMLLPALYVQSRDGKGIYKKYSFEKAKTDFSSKEWSIMDEVSSMRKDWIYNISHVKKYFFSMSHPFSRSLVKKYAPQIPLKIKKRLSDSFYRAMISLINTMNNNLSIKY